MLPLSSCLIQTLKTCVLISVSGRRCFLVPDGSMLMRHVLCIACALHCGVCGMCSELRCGNRGTRGQRQGMARSARGRTQTLGMHRLPIVASSSAAAKIQTLQPGQTVGLWCCQQVVGLISASDETDLLHRRSLTTGKNTIQYCSQGSPYNGVILSGVILSLICSRCYTITNRCYTITDMHPGPVRHVGPYQTVMMFAVRNIC